MWCEAGGLEAREKISYNAKQQSKSGCFFREVVDWIEEGSGFVWIEEKPKGTKLTFRKQVCDVCMKVKDYFAKLFTVVTFTDDFSADHQHHSLALFQPSALSD